MVTSTHTWGISTPTPFLGRAITTNVYEGIYQNQRQHPAHRVSVPWWCFVLLRVKRYKLGGHRNYDIDILHRRQYRKTYQVLYGNRRCAGSGPHGFLKALDFKRERPERATGGRKRNIAATAAEGALPLLRTAVQGASLRKEKYIKSDRCGPRLIVFFFMIVVANWRLDNAKSPAAMLQEKTARTPHTLRLPGGCRT